MRARKLGLMGVVGFAILGSAGAVATGVAQTSSPPGYAGIWIDDTGKGAVQIAPCGSNLCGRIVWLKTPIDKAGRPLRDALNPKPAMRTRPICGLQVIGALSPRQDGSWDGGWIYDPKAGKSYDVALRLRTTDRLEVTGYLGVKLLSETFVWKRAAAGIPLCMPPSGARRAAN